MNVDGSKISFHNSGGRGRYGYPVDGQEAELTFTKVGAGQIIIDHTYVPAAFRGRGIAEALVLRAVEDARRQGLKIRPLCSFAAAQFHAHPEWRDLLA